MDSIAFVILLIISKVEVLDMASRRLGADPLGEQESARIKN